MLIPRLGVICSLSPETMYSPSTARFDSDNGLVYRLSVQGFASDDAARDFCESLQQAGGSCFVRTVAGDAPVRLAAL